MVGSDLLGTLRGTLTQLLVVIFQLENAQNNERCCCSLSEQRQNSMTKTVVLHGLKHGMEHTGISRGTRHQITVLKDYSEWTELNQYQTHLSEADSSHVWAFVKP